MKFMKRTRDKTEKMEEEEVRSQMFDSEVTPAMRVEGDRFIMEPSFVNIENLKFGRFSYKGMNPEIETIMLEEANLEEATRQDVDVTDQEMADRYKNLVGTIEKKFSKKRDAGGKRAGPSRIPPTTASVPSSTANIISQASQFLSQVRLETEQAAQKKAKFKKPAEED